MTNFMHGRQAEASAAEFLKSKGYKVVCQNWRTRVCEIDIVAQKANVIYFCEVKYRINNAQGSGLDYITPVKLRQMEFAARQWVTQHRWDGDYRLAALEVSGSDYKATAFIDDIV